MVGSQLTVQPHLNLPQLVHGPVTLTALCTLSCHCHLLLSLVLCEPHLERSESLQFKLLCLQAALSLVQLCMQILYLYAALPVLPLHLPQCPLGLEIK